MKTQKMSLANIQGKLSRTEMKNIKGGSCMDVCNVAYSGTSSQCVPPPPSPFPDYTVYNNCMNGAMNGFNECIVNSCGELPY